VGHANMDHGSSSSVAVSTSPTKIINKIIKTDGDRGVTNNEFVKFNSKTQNFFSALMQLDG